jgi:ketosteroid isomerase-like protein
MGASSAVTDGIVNANQAFKEAFNSGDAAGVAALYTADGQLAAPNSDIIEGAEALAGFWKAFIEMGLKVEALDTVEVDEYGDSAVEQGRYRLVDADGNAVDHGKYMILWKRDGVGWKLHRDIFNSSAPAAH